MRSNRDFQKIVTSKLNHEQIITLYRKMVTGELTELQEAETVPEIIKEACDVHIVCEPLRMWGDHHDNLLHDEIASAMCILISSHGVSVHKALKRVVDSNFSKFILESELTSAQAYFHGLGISVRFDHLGDEYFGAYSQKDQTVDGKFYECDKLLKGPNYQAVDESIEWWT